MATIIKPGYTDTIPTKKSIEIPDLSWAADFAVKRDDPSEVILTNTTSPLDQPETIRFAYQSIADIYKNTGIDPSFVATTKRGISLLAQVNDTYRVESEGTTGCCGVTYDLPISAHVVLRVPVNQQVTSDIVLDVLLRAVATLFNTGETSSARVNALLRGALMPTGM